MSSRQHSQIKGIARLIPSLVLGLVSLLAAGEAKAFNFTRIADTTSPQGYISFGTGLGSPSQPYGYYSPEQKGISISNSGRVAFFANMNTGHQSIYTALDDQILSRKIIASTNNPSYISFGQGISISDNDQQIPGTPARGRKGDVAFFATLNTGETGIYLVKNDSTNRNKIADTNGIFSSFQPGLSLNNNHTVAFATTLSNGINDIYKSNGSVDTPITDCSSSNPECPLSQWWWGPSSPSINDSGTVAFTGVNGVFAGDGIPSGGNFGIISDPGNFVNGSYQEANINENGWTSATALAVPGSAIGRPGVQGNVIWLYRSLYEKLVVPR